ncbi:hypothetical protein DPMN_164450 [Dreissena polymorpha]|uniref:Uncharacterized protein n=1 Tax=Dreissena polymorpha TaxID=45954 RepID=A0A9D4EVY6_DREPO|nr:hypothetical protein DPMN_164450 [Dreissena polymorpha]
MHVMGVDDIVTVRFSLVSKRNKLYKLTKLNDLHVSHQSAVRCSAVQYTAVDWNGVEWSAVKCGEAQWSTVECSGGGSGRVDKYSSTV